MRHVLGRARHDERGTSLILAIVFMLVIGGIGGAVTASVTSGVKDRSALDRLRNQEYAADGGVEYAIAQVRAIPLPGGPGIANCGPYTNTLDNFTIRIDCSNQPTIAAGPLQKDDFLQRDVLLTACVDNGSACNDNTTLMRAQVNFEAHVVGSSLVVTRTWVQSWSVNG